MWYETLIPLGIVGILITLPHFIAGGSNWYFFNGNPHRRDPTLHWDMDMLIRDKRVTNGRHWQTPGLEAIPDQ